ncbi:MAG: alpha/beta hydrolase [Cyanobacteria bacterium J06648_11]
MAASLQVEWIAAPERSDAGIAQIVLMHGWGANSSDLMPLARELSLPHCDFGFPNAPLPHPNVPGGRAWYDLESGAGLDESALLLQEWLEGLPERSGVPLSRTILGGFSQGGAMTLRVGLTLPLAGLMCLSGYLAASPPRDRLVSSLPPVWMAHGKQDPVIAVDIARQSQAAIAELGADVTYREYEMGHQIIPDELMQMRAFVANQS